MNFSFIFIHPLNLGKILAANQDLFPFCLQKYDTGYIFLCFLSAVNKIPIKSKHNSSAMVLPVRENHARMVFRTGSSMS